jgi:hypothetical protein
LQLESGDINTIIGKDPQSNNITNNNWQVKSRSASVFTLGGKYCFIILLSAQSSQVEVSFPACHCER